MRVAVVAESFLPNMNGVTNSILRVLDHLKAHGHEAIVIAPAARKRQYQITEYKGFPIVTVPSVVVPKIDSLPVGVPTLTLPRTLKEFQPDVVHLASPFALGGAGAVAARRAGLPAVAIYQTDVAGFANTYDLKLLSKAAWWWARTLHNMCCRNLAPSSATIAELDEHGIRNIHKWARGVDGVRFHPNKRSKELRKQWSPEGKPIVGFVGRLASEKSAHRLEGIAQRDDVQVVIVGDGPERTDLENRMPTAVFTGELRDEKLAEAFASLDLFVHTGEYETFCQAVQEAHASGVPVIAPDAGGPKDLVNVGVDGELLPVDSFTDLLPAAVDRWTGEISGDDLRAVCRASVEGKTWESLCEQLLDHYAAVSGVPARKRTAGRRTSITEPTSNRPTVEHPTTQRSERRD